ncbi:MAG: hypothetical protein GY778_11510 [bacterium]|nr:hypothetical protein [bacterium]
MKCPRVREYLFAFLDDELDAPHSIEVQRHLERCPQCAREAEIERTVRKRLEAALVGEGADAPPGDEMTLRRLLDGKTQSTARSHRLLRLALPMGAAAALVAAVIIWTAVTDRHVEPPPQRFADLLVADFKHFVGEGRQLQFASADATQVGRWLADRTGLNVALPSMQGDDCRLLGARKCKISKRPAAFALYDMHGAPVSLVALAARPEELSGMQEITDDGPRRWVDRCQGHTVVAARRGDLLYAAVAKLSERELTHLVKGVVDASH